MEMETVVKAVVKAAVKVEQVEKVVEVKAEQGMEKAEWAIHLRCCEVHLRQLHKHLNHEQCGSTHLRPMMHPKNFLFSNSQHHFRFHSQRAKHRGPICHQLCKLA